MKGSELTVTETEQRTGYYMQTVSGRRFWPEDPRAEDVDLRDIAHALSQICRFGGHTEQFYSVAQHSTLVADCVARMGGDSEQIMWGLLHDAAEAYIGDMIWPIKNSHTGAMAEYKRVERRVMTAISEKFNLAPPWDHGPLCEPPEIVLNADRRVLLGEARDLMGDPEWAAERVSLGGEQPYPEHKIIPQRMELARIWFMDRFDYIQDRRT